MDKDTKLEIEKLKFEKDKLDMIIDLTESGVINSKREVIKTPVKKEKVLIKK